MEKMEEDDQVQDQNEAESSKEYSYVPPPKPGNHGAQYHLQNEMKYVGKIYDKIAKKMVYLTQREYNVKLFEFQSSMNESIEKDHYEEATKVTGYKFGPGVTAVCHTKEQADNLPNMPVMLSEAELQRGDFSGDSREFSYIPPSKTVNHSSSKPC